MTLKGWTVETIERAVTSLELKKHFFQAAARYQEIKKVCTLALLLL